MILISLVAVTAQAETGSTFNSKKVIADAELVCQITGEKNQGHYTSFSSAGAVLITQAPTSSEEFKMDVYADLTGTHKESFKVHTVDSPAFLIYRDSSGEAELTVHKQSISLKDQLADGYLGALRVRWNMQSRKFIIKCVNPKESPVHIERLEDLED
jgi:hypothetical protein